MDTNPIGIPPLPALPVFGPFPQNRVESEESKLKEAAEGFEGYFIYTLLKEMQKTVPKGNLFGLGPGGEIYQHLFHQALADSLSGQNGIGLSKMLIEHLHRKQERRITMEELAGRRPEPPGGTDMPVSPKGPVEPKPFYPIGR